VFVLRSELVFIGLGLHDGNGISMRGLREARSCDRLFAEFYTSLMPGLDLQGLRNLVGRDVQVLKRKDVEENAERIILSQARASKVGFLVPGDPMVATTHVDLRLRASKAGIKTRVLHAASVVSAIAGATGLQTYKLGKTVTFPATWQGGLPESIYAAIKSNREIGLHTLGLLEVDVENRRYISIGLALKQLLALFEQKTDRTISSDTLVVGVARLESPDMIVKAGMLSEVAEYDFGEPPYAVIIPSHLHFMEAEALHVFCGAPKHLVGLEP